MVTGVLTGSQIEAIEVQTGKSILRPPVVGRRPDRLRAATMGPYLFDGDGVDRKFHEFARYRN